MSTDTNEPSQDWREGYKAGLKEWAKKEVEETFSAKKAEEKTRFRDKAMAEKARLALLVLFIIVGLGFMSTFAMIGFAGGIVIGVYGYHTWKE